MACARSLRLGVPNKILADAKWSTVQSYADYAAGVTTPLRLRAHGDSGVYGLR